MKIFKKMFSVNVNILEFPYLCFIWLQYMQPCLVLDFFFVLSIQIQRVRLQKKPQKKVDRNL